MERQGMRKTRLWFAVTLAAVGALGYLSVSVLRSPELPPGIIYGNGHIEGTEVAVSAEVTGRVLESTLQEGQQVRQGNLLVRLDDAELSARQAQLEAELEVARRQGELLEIQLGKTRIEAPIEGTLLAKGIEVGELAAPGRVVAVLVDLNRLELTVYVPENDIGKIKLGDPARVRVDAFSERYFEARVARVDSRAQFTPRDIHMPEERVRMVFGVTLALANPEGYLKPGMPADAWIRWDPNRPWPERLTIPGG